MTSGIEEANLSTIRTRFHILRNRLFNSKADLKDIDDGYNDLIFQDYIAQKTKLFASNISNLYAENLDTKTMASLGYVTRCDITNVIEVGGGAGKDFFIARILKS